MIKQLCCAVILLVSLGCSSARSAHLGGVTFQSSGQKIADVEVAIDRTRIDAERLEVFDELRGLERIREYTLQHLREIGLFDAAAGNRMKVAVTDFRVRHGTTAVFLGVLAGRDSVAADVTVESRNRKILSYSVDEKSAGRVFGISSSSRGNALFEDIGVAAAERLRE